jgi:ornithine cyclodeaminase
LKFFLGASMLLIPETELRGLITYRDAVDAIEGAFAALARGEVVQPDPLNFDLPQLEGEIHVKGAHRLGDRHIVVKLATGFWRNAARGLPSGGGLMIVIDAATGFPSAILLDNGYLTDLRTGAAGGVAARALANSAPQRVLLVGAGVQAHMQLLSLAAVRPIETVAVWSRREQSAQKLVEELRGAGFGAVGTVPSIAEGMRDASLVITVTPSHEPLIQAEWLRPGMHITAVGSDGPDKQELAADVLARADVVVADRLSQCERLGEIHHAFEAGLQRDRVFELGDIVIGKQSGRTSEGQITICDLTGVGVQDAAIAGLAWERYRAVNQPIPL